MATYNKFQSFVQALAHKEHNLATDQLVVALCAAVNAPVATNSVLANLTPIAYTYLDGVNPRNITTSASAHTAGTYKLTLADLTLTASGGSVAAFQYVVIYNDTHATDGLICWYDYGSEIVLAAGETLLIDFDAANGLLQLA